MDEEIWGLYDRAQGIEVSLRRTDPKNYELNMITWFGRTNETMILDRKHLKDLFNAIGNELNAF